MDIENGTVSQDCSEAVYSEEYLNFLIKYNNDLQSVYESVNPDCITIINNQFLVAFRRAGSDDSDKMFWFGYDAAPRCYGLMDISAIAAIGADRVRNIPGLALTGNGVLIGFLDTGIDYTNPVFRNADGSTRIEAIWDQTEQVVGSAPAVYGYGAEFTAEDINRALASAEPYDIVPTRDENGHGTFVASVAAGRDIPEESFTGIAPEAGIVAVKLKEAKRNLRDFYLINENVPCYSEDDIVLGIKYLIGKAVALGRPLIICMTVGTNQGDHGGNTNLELYLDSISSLRGVCIIAAGGNELGYSNHFSGNNRIERELSQDAMEIYVGPDDRGFAMEIWGNSPGLLRVSIVSPTGERAEQIPYNRDGVVRIPFIYEGTVVYVENVVVEKSTGDQMIFFRFENPAEGIWTINVTEMTGMVGRGFNAWLPIHEFMNSDTVFVRPDPDITVCSPGNGNSLITVSGYNHYTKALYVNSSRGYTRKGGVIKPDIAAPAVDVYGAYLGSRLLFTRGTGTSAASAVTAGAVALLMEWGVVKGNSPGMNTEAIRQLLIRGVQRVADVEYPNRSWGWGALDIYGAFEAIRNT